MKYSNPVRRKIAEGGVILCAMQRLPNPSATEIMAMSGIDMICIDNEHYPFSVNTVERIARAAHIHGASVFMRVPGDDPARIAQMMDCGLQGIKVPHVESRAQAQAIVDAVKYAPMGTRGFCPITRAACYGNGMTPEEFARISNENTFVVPQIETKEGVEDIDRILSIPEVDWVPIGPSDLSASYGCPGSYDDPRVVGAIQTVREKSKALGKSGGVMCHSPQAIADAKAEGVTFLSLGSDQQILMNGLKQLVGAVREWQANQK